MTGSKYFQQVNLDINYNWEKTKFMVDKLLSCRNSTTETEQVGNSTHYNLKSLGVISDHDLSDSWFRVTGPAVNSTIPWLSNMLTDMAELKPDGGAISFLKGPAAGHIDLQILPSALNYIFYSEDASAHTWVKDENNIVETYNSQEKTAWILNTQILHGIESKGTRYALSIHFGVEYGKVVEWFLKNNNLKYGYN